jgi:hypothetical protein
MRIKELHLLYRRLRRDFSSNKGLDRFVFTQGPDLLCQFGPCHKLSVPGHCNDDEIDKHNSEPNRR